MSVWEAPVKVAGKGAHSAKGTVHVQAIHSFGMHKLLRCLPYVAGGDARLLGSGRSPFTQPRQAPRRFNGTPG